MATKLTLAFSSCPNDTFMFDAMVHHKIDTEGLEFDCYISDIEDLNLKAFQQTFDISKLSFHAFLYLYKNYALLRSGSALGENVGPLLISKYPHSMIDVSNLHVAIPGKYTTANMLLKLTVGDPSKSSIFVFSEIEDAILNNKVDAGVIIHENRFTYQQKGLYKIADLGELWAKNYDENIPLGGIFANRNLPLEIQKKVERVLHRSILYAFENPESSIPFMKQHAQNMQDEVMKQHVGLYVNNYSINLGEKGENSVYSLFKHAIQKGLIPSIETENLFV